MEPMSMELPIYFSGGPLDGQAAMTESLDEVKLFFNSAGKQVYAYRRLDELVWRYEPSMSVQLSQIYDHTFERFGSASTVRFPGESDA
jgi:hypothetical protein